MPSAHNATSRFASSDERNDIVQATLQLTGKVEKLLKLLEASDMENMLAMDFKFKGVLNCQI